MADARPQRPELAVNRSFMSAFLAEDPPCLALGMVEDGASRCALLALRLDRTLPQQVSAGGFSFGHALFGGDTWEVVHFAFYGFATYNVLINPSDQVAQTVLDAMVRSGDYFFFALDGDRRATAFRSPIGRDNLSVLYRNTERIGASHDHTLKFDSSCWDRAYLTPCAPI